MKCLLPLIVLLTGCAHQVTREEVLATAYRYTQVKWLPQAANVRHGRDGEGIMVHTPDLSITSHGGARGWWQPGVPATSMPYQWGGFDTPESFLQKISTGKKAGDVGDAAKRRLGDAGTSSESCGIDCSGFVSRCWGLSRPYSTRELHQLCEPLPSWEVLLPGDILLSHQHVVLFVKWTLPGKEFDAYEAGPFPVWKVSSCGLSAKMLRIQGYAPWRYRGIVDGRSKLPFPSF